MMAKKFLRLKRKVLGVGKGGHMILDEDKHTVWFMWWEKGAV
ncbi:hypothetical protein FACS189499_10290 [Clostridia bacterium]|nr:hypothetical protein FACS189499_10290 [Clostridia bacterium]